MKEEATKEDWQKILTQMNMQLKQSLMNAAIYRNTAKLAREMLESFKLLDDERRRRVKHP